MVPTRFLVDAVADWPTRGRALRGLGVQGIVRLFRIGKLLQSVRSFRILKFLGALRILVLLGRLEGGVGLDGLFVTSRDQWSMVKSYSELGQMKGRGLV